MNTKTMNWKRILGIVVLCITGANAVLSFFNTDVSQTAYVCACLTEFVLCASLVISNWKNFA